MPFKTSACLTTLLAMLAILLATGARSSAQVEVLHNFNPNNMDGLGPYDSRSLVLDAGGNLFGTTNSGGAYDTGSVFEMTPRPGGGWAEKVIHSFNFDAGDAAYPFAGLVLDASGNLYGTANGGAFGDGTVFELARTEGGGWTEILLHSFDVNTLDGSAPRASLVFDSAGDLYGTTQYGGAYGAGIVFKMTHSGRTWTEKVIHNFGSNDTDGIWPYSSLILDGAGNLYGTTWEGGPGSGGTVFELTPETGGGWSEKILVSFDNTESLEGAFPYSGLILDAAGDLYGTTYLGGIDGGGTVFELSPGTGGTWTHKIVHNFKNDGRDGLGPYAGLIVDAAGNLYGTTVYGGGGECVGLFFDGCGTVFELTPQADGSWTERVFHDFNNNGVDGLYPYSGLIFVSATDLAGTTELGGTYGDGTVFEVTP